MLTLDLQYKPYLVFLLQQIKKSILLSKISLVSLLFSSLYLPLPSPPAGVQAEGDAGNALRGHLACGFHRQSGHRLLAHQGPHVRRRLGRRAVPLQVRLNRINTHTVIHCVNTHILACKHHFPTFRTMQRQIVPPCLKPINSAIWSRCL